MARRDVPTIEIDGEPRDEDILSGRGGRTNNHKGNKTIFLPLIVEHKDEYLRADTKGKARIVDLVIQLVLSHEGKPRFVEPYEGKWYESPIKNIRAKVRQAYRDKYTPKPLQDKARIKYPDVWARHLERKAARAEKNYGKKKKFTAKKNKPKTRKAPVPKVAQPVLAINRHHAAVTDDEDDDGPRDEGMNAAQEDDVVFLLQDSISVKYNDEFIDEFCGPGTTNPAELVIPWSLEADIDWAPMASILPDLQATPLLIGQVNSSSNPIETAMLTPPVDFDCSAETMCFFSYGRMSTSLDYLFDEMIHGPIDLLKEEITDFDDPFKAMYYQPMSVPRSSE